MECSKGVALYCVKHSIEALNSTQCSSTFLSCSTDKDSVTGLLVIHILTALSPSKFGCHLKVTV